MQPRVTQLQTADGRSIAFFRLDRPLVIGRGEYGRDNGYMRNGHHYHYYEGDNANRDQQYRNQQEQYPPDR